MSILRRPHWRVMTWVVLVFNVVALAWVIASAASVGNPNHCVAGQAGELCRSATSAGTGIGVGILIALWIAGDIVLGLLWLVTRGRECRACGRRMRRGAPVCRHCGFDHRTQAVPS